MTMTNAAEMFKELAAKIAVFEFRERFSFVPRMESCKVKSLIGMIYDDERKVRIDAIYDLGRSGNILAVEPLIKLLKDSDETIRFFSVRSLGDIGDSRAVEPLVELYENEYDIEIQSFALIALVDIGGRKVVDYLLKRFEGKNHYWVGVLLGNSVNMQIYIAWGLAKTSNHIEAINYLREHLNDPDMNIRKVAAHQLADVKDPMAIAALFKLLENRKTQDYKDWWVTVHHLGKFFRRYPDIVENALLSALKENKIAESNATEILKDGGIRNPNAYLQYLVNKRAMDFSFIPCMTACDLYKVPECCKRTLHPGDEAIAILGKGKEIASIHSLGCPEIKPAYWS